MRWVRWLSVETVADALGFQPDTVRDWIKAGKFGNHTTRIGGQWRVSELGMKHMVPHPDNHCLDAPRDDVIVARTTGELRRKLIQQAIQPGHD